MTEDEQRPKKAVRRVVRKTVVRPAAQPSPSTRTPSAKGPASRMPRVTRDAADAQATKATVPTRRTPSAKGTGPTTPARETPPRGRSPKIGPTRKPAGERGPSIPDRVGTAGRRALEGARSGVTRVGRGLQSGGRRVVGVRAPHWPGPAGAAVAGAIAGLLGALLGAAFLELFSRLLGVRSGGGWGIPVLALVLFAAGWVGSLALTALGHSSARLIAFLGVVVGLVVLLVTLPSAAETSWAFLVVPALGAASFAAAQALVRAAETLPAEKD